MEAVLHTVRNVQGSAELEGGGGREEHCACQHYGKIGRGKTLLILCIREYYEGITHFCTSLMMGKELEYGSCACDTLFSALPFV